MAEDAAHRLIAAVDAVLERRELGDVTASRMRRAIGELVGRGDDGRHVVVEQYRRVALSSGDQLPEDVRTRITEILMAGWANPTQTKPAAKGSSRTVARTRKDRDLRYVPDGTVVVYDGVQATIRGGWITVDGQRGRFDAVTPAAKAVTGQESVNGWVAWRLEDGRKLADVYDTGDW